jgi:hypothetical protein
VLLSIRAHLNLEVFLTISYTGSTKFATIVGYTLISAHKMDKILKIGQLFQREKVWTKIQ